MRSTRRGVCPHRAIVLDLVWREAARDSSRKDWKAPRVRVAVRPNAMPDPAADWWLVLHVAARCLENGSVRPFWPVLERYAAHPGLLTRGLATLVWLGLLLAVPLLAERRHRLVARTLEETVRRIVGGEQVSAAIDRGVRGLVRRGLGPERARDDLERLLVGFLSGAPKAATVAAPATTTTWPAIPDVCRSYHFAEGER